jgi:hypothetical protein
VNVLPVIERELRAESRHPTTYLFRPIAACAVLIASMFLLFGHPTATVIGTGQSLFASLHKILFVTIWILVPLMTADCVSREKREQTLGLLFLTPLKAGEIMVAKGLVHGLRAATVCVAVVPPLMLPLLLGGVSWAAALASILINASAFLWALAAGLLASVLARTVTSGIVWALSWSAVFLAGLALLNGFAVYQIAVASTGRNWSIPSLEWLAGMGLLNLWRPHDSLPYVFRTTAALASSLWILAGIVFVLISFVGLVAVWRLSAWQLKKSWQDLPPSPQRQALARHFCEPRIALKFFRARLRRQIERNPVGWLERRHWASRTAAWAWMGILTVVYTMSFVNLRSLDDLDRLMPVLIIGMAAALALTSAASLRRERESGVMELLLTTPLTPEQIVRGRLQGIWKQFLPAGLLFGAMTSMLHRKVYGTFSTEETLMALWSVGMFYLVIPVAGLWFSLRLRHYVAALIATVGVGVVLPWILTYVILEYPFAGGRRQPVPGLVDYGLAAVVTTLAMWGVAHLRRSIRGVVAAFLAIALLAIVGSISGVTDPWSSNYRDPEEPWIMLTCGGLQIALAGVAHRQLLRNLRDRMFAFQV